VWRLLGRHDLTFKKKTAHASEQQRPDVLRCRQAWFELQPELVPIDWRNTGVPQASGGFGVSE